MSFWWEVRVLKSPAIRISKKRFCEKKIYVTGFVALLRIVAKPGSSSLCLIAHGLPVYPWACRRNAVLYSVSSLSNFKNWLQL